MNRKNLTTFLANRYTGFRFSWGMYSLFFSIGTFCLVLTDRFPQISFVEITIMIFLVFALSSVVFDKLKIRQKINESESKNNPVALSTNDSVKEILSILKGGKV